MAEVFRDPQFAGPLVPSNVEEWISHLQGRLMMQRQQVTEYFAHYDGEISALAFAQAKYTEEFGDLFGNWRVNISEIVADLLAERLNIQGFRMSEEPEADEEASEIWQRSGMDREAPLATVEMLVGGQTFLKVWGDSEDKAIITPESALECAVQYYPGSRTKVGAALKWYFDEFGAEWTELYLPDRIYKNVRPAPGKQWETTKDIPNPLKQVPIVPLRNRARLSAKPRSELASIVPLEKAIGKLAADMLVNSEFNAYPQRIIAGLELLENPDGTLAAPIKSAIDRLLVFEEAEVKWGQFEASDLKGYVEAINLMFQIAATVARLPAHYMLVGGTTQAPSGEALQSSETALVSKAQRIQRTSGEDWEDVMRLAFAVQGDSARAQYWNAEIIWEDAEHRSEAVATDAAVKKVQAGIIPAAQAAEDLGYTPTQIQRFDDMIAEDQQRAIEHQRAMAEITGGIGGAAPAGNGSKANEASKPSASNRGNTARKIADR
ncbi:phage portal protein [Actinomadura rubrisoli]|uniref:Phage portal protein n=1 Tax=Actinomadura rubrisoli TaxID=2530368 RepID=A0A4R5CIK2_9ACTN|nr:phage portal protein [Actinomadura rubrisoli]TDD97164.1 phage portal protein [Actinomadura rubrisoli]